MALVQLIKGTTKRITHKTTLLYDVIESLLKGFKENDVQVNVRSYGAVGDWDSIAKTGTDDTAAVQAAINVLDTVTSPREGGHRLLWFPAGQYRVKNLVIPASMEYGLCMRGPGRDASALWIHPDDLSTVGVDCQIEFTSVDGMSLYGGQTLTNDLNARCQVMWRTKLPDGRADCDFKLGSDTRALGANVLFQMHGRGFIADNVISGMCTSFLDIAGGIMSWPTAAAGQYQGSVYTGMRDYQITNSRFDNATNIVTVSVTGPQKDYVNGITVEGNDLFGCGKMLNAPDAIVQYSKFNNNVGVGMYVTKEGCVYARRMLNSSVCMNILANWYNRAQLPDSNLRYFYGLVNILESSEGNDFDDNILPYSVDQTVRVGSTSRDTSVSRNTLFQVGLIVTAQSANFIMFRGANCARLVMKGNKLFQTGGTNPQSLALFDSNIQVSEVAVGGNQSNISLGIVGGSYNVQCTYGAQNVTLSSVSASVNSEDGYVQLRMHAALPVLSGSASDEVAFSLPFTAIAESVASSQYSGYGPAVQAGTSTFSLQGARVYTAQQKVYLIKADGSTLKRGDITTAIAVSFDVKYRHL